MWRVEFSFKREALHELQQENTSREVLFWGVEDAYLERVKRDFSAEVQRKRLKFGLQSV